MPDREILFRGKRLDNGEWVYGGYVYAETDGSAGIASTDGFFDVDPSTVSQYTGITDKHGTRIFEGDRVAIINPKPFAPNMGTVVFDGGCFVVVFDRREFGDGCLKNLIGGWLCEVIGNRWDGPARLSPPPGEEAPHDPP